MDIILLIPTILFLKLTYIWGGWIGVVFFIILIGLVELEIFLFFKWANKNLEWFMY